MFWNRLLDKLVGNIKIAIFNTTFYFAFFQCCAPSLFYNFFFSDVNQDGFKLNTSMYNRNLTLTLYKVLDFYLIV